MCVSAHALIARRPSVRPFKRSPTDARFVGALRPNNTRPVVCRRQSVDRGRSTIEQLLSAGSDPHPHTVEMAGRRSTRIGFGRCACLAARTLAVVWTLAATTMVDMVESGLERTCTSQQLSLRPMRGICGPRLSGMLCVLCRRYNKRSVDSKFPLIINLILSAIDAVLCLPCR